VKEIFIKAVNHDNPIQGVFGTSFGNFHLCNTLNFVKYIIIFFTFTMVDINKNISQNFS
jgi:hypothetical protein